MSLLVSALLAGNDYGVFEGLVQPVLSVIAAAIPAVVAAYIIHKAVSGGESVKVLIAEAVIAIGVLEGVVAIAGRMTH